MAQDGLPEDLPEVIRELLLEGERLAAAGRTEQAIQAYRRAIEGAPRLAAPYLTLGSLLHGEGQREEALQVFTEGLEVVPEDRQLLFNAAVSALGLSRAEDALQYSGRALDVAPRDADLRVLHGTVLRQLGRLGDAVESLETAARLSPSSARVHYRLGNLYYEAGRLGDAAEAFRRATREERGFLRAYANLGAVLFDLGEETKALEAYEIALEPVDKAFRSGEAVEPAYAQAYRNLGAIQLRRAAWQESLEAYEKALRLAPDATGADAAAALYNQGFVLVRLGRDQEAEESYQRALELEPELPLAYLDLGRIALRRSDPSSAAKHLEAAVTRLAGKPGPPLEDGSPPLLAAWRGLASARRALGDAAGEEAALRAVTAAAPEDLEALVALGSLLRRGGRPMEARPLLERARALAPENRAAIAELAATLGAMGDRSTQAALYEDLLAEAQGPREAVPIAARLAVLRLREGETQAARSLLEPWLQELAEAKKGDRRPPREPRKGRAAEAARETLPTAARHSLATIYALLVAADGDRAMARQILGSVLAEAAGAGEPAPPTARDASIVLTALDGESIDLTDASEPHRALLEWVTDSGDAARAALENVVAAEPDAELPRLALGEIALANGELEAALSHFEIAARCGARENAQNQRVTASESGVLRIHLEPEGDPWCERAQSGLGAALAVAAHASLARAAADSGARQVALRLAERALSLPLTSVARAMAQAVRGTSRLMTGDLRGARNDLQVALGSGALPVSMIPFARVNLGVALHRRGETEAAREQLETARSAAGTPPAALLALGALREEADGDAAGALELYEEYVAAGGRRAVEVAQWVERLREVYR